LAMFKSLNAFLSEVNKQSSSIVDAMQIEKEKEKLNKLF